MPSTRPVGPAPPALSRRRALGVLGGASAAALLSGCAVTSIPTTVSDVGLSKHPAPGRKTVIEMYNCQGAPTGQGVVEMAKAFEKANPDIGVRVTYSPVVQQDVQPKLLTAIAAGSPPDVGMVGSEYAQQWSQLDMMIELTRYAKRDGVTPDRFVTKAAAQKTWQSGKMWTLQWEADPNFPLFWNKDLFEQAGLDPDKPPTTIDEVDEFSKKMLKRKGGLITQIGMIPWQTYGFANSMYTWGFAFGGQFYDPEKNVLTPDHEMNVKALEWMVKYAKDMGGAQNVATTPPGLTVHPFGGGHIGMSPLVAANYQSIRQALPKMKIGSGLLPYQPPGAHSPGQGAWLGGWSFFVPKGARNPDAAWRFMRWCCATAAGTEAMWKNIGYLPVYKDTPALDEARTSKDMSPYYTALMSITNVRPAVPASSVLSNAMEKNVSEAIFGQLTPLQALRASKDAAMEEWKRFERQVGSGS